MSLLPAVVPAIPEARAGVVPARLARKVGPLFGVAWPDGPFGSRTWVSDYGRITLSEIARGAPLPARGQMPEASTDDMFVRRFAAPAHPLPNEIANATLNRFGPDTKAAVVLTAANELLVPVRDAIASVPPLVDAAGRPVHPALRLVAWAALVVEAFRSQPALVAAGIRARAIQRPLTLLWDLPVAPDAAGVLLTRCEIGAPHGNAATSSPRDLDVADATFRTLEFPDDVAADPLARSRVHDLVVGQLLDRLLVAGTNQDSSHLWLSERTTDGLVVEALVPAAGLVDRFARQTLTLMGFDPGMLDQPPPLPRPPDPGLLAGAPLLSRRATVLAHLAVLRQVHQSPPAREAARADVLDRIDAVLELARRTLPEGDPVRAVGACRAALMAVQVLRHDAGQDITAAVSALREAARHCEDLSRTGVLDRGTAAEILAASNVEINAVRFINATLSGAGLPAAGELDAEVRARWSRVLSLLEVAGDPAGDQPVRLAGLLGYHLHNYAAYLASHPTDTDDLAAAVRLFRDVVIPARATFVARSASFEPLRRSLHMGARATTALAQIDPGRSREWAALGREWIKRALADEGTRRLLAEPTEAGCRFALRAAPALVLAAELDVPGAGPTDVAEAEAMLDLARRWELRAVGPDRARHVRHTEIDDLDARIAVVRAKAAVSSPG
jgi:hypothetical protein